MTEANSAFLQGTALLRERRTIEAIPYLEEAYELQPDDVDIAINLSGAYILTKNFKKAVNILESTANQAPGHAMVWTNLGAAYLGNPVLARDADQKRAIAAFERALEIDPAAYSVAYNIGLIYRDRREKGEAIYWMRQAVEHNPHDRDAKRLLDKLEAA